MAQKLKHDVELDRLAKHLMKLPFNKPGTEKGHVLQAIFYYNEFYSMIKPQRND